MTTPMYLTPARKGNSSMDNQHIIFLWLDRADVLSALPGIGAPCGALSAQCIRVL
jgi:hypothetical protein